MFDDQMIDQGTTSSEVEEATPAPLEFGADAPRLSTTTVNRAELKAWNAEAKRLPRPGVSVRGVRAVLAREADTIDRVLGGDFAVGRVASAPSQRIRGGGGHVTTPTDGDSGAAHASRSALMWNLPHERRFAVARALNSIDSAFIEGDDPSLYWTGPSVPLSQRFSTTHLNREQYDALPRDGKSGAFEVGCGIHGTAFCVRYPSPDALAAFDKTSRPQWAREVLTPPPGRSWQQGHGWCFAEEQQS